MADPTGEWFFARPRYSFEGDGRVDRIVKLTTHRVYYGEPRKTWRDKAREPAYFDKSQCVVIGVDEATARAVASAWATASQKCAGAKRHHAEQIGRITSERDTEISAILAGGLAP